MEQALYHPQWGYYSSGISRTGRNADFLTSPTLTPAFAAIIARWAQHCWEAADRPQPFAFVEQGAGDGSFAASFLAALATPDSTDFREALVYRIIEPFERVRDLQVNTLRSRGIIPPRITWHSSVADADPFHGIHFSNELPDAMPVHLCVRRDTGWMECGVANSEGGFGWVELPVADPGCIAFLEALPVVFPEGYRMEVNLAATAWIAEVASRLVSGHVLAIDYGHSFADRYDPRKSAGTLSAYRGHRREPDVLASPGETDLTCHVDFSGLARAGVAAGLQVAEYTTQSRFLTHAAALSLPHLASRHPDGLRFLLHPTSLGDSFKALLLSKEANPPTPWNSQLHRAKALERLGLDES